MNPVTMVLVAVGLAMDCLAVSTSCAMANSRVSRKSALVLALSFGGFQGGMAFLGWLGGAALAGYIEPWDHWLAFGLLLLIGLRMIVEARRDEADSQFLNPERPRTVLLLSVATSIDALAVGISFAFLHSQILVPVLLIGMTSTVFTLAGLRLGRGLRNMAADDVSGRMELVGGLVLIALGVEILAEHLFL